MDKPQKENTTVLTVPSGQDSEAFLREYFGCSPSESQDDADEVVVFEVKSE